MKSIVNVGEITPSMTRGNIVDDVQVRITGSSSGRQTERKIIDRLDFESHEILFF